MMFLKYLREQTQVSIRSNYINPAIAEYVNSIINKIFFVKKIKREMGVFETHKSKDKCEIAFQQ